jgi:hypothetical protein
MAERKTAGESKRGRCPACKEKSLVPILYGPLPDSLAADRERGDVYWGGLERPPDSPRWKCVVCHRSFSNDEV